jgi:CBS domain-containing protein
MHPGILSCDAEASLTDVARLMSSHHVHCIVVARPTDGEGEDAPAWGIISDLDLVTASLRADRPDTAARLAQHPALEVETTAALRDAAELMLSRGSSHVVAVTPDTRRPVGILSTLDIAGVLASREM